jgi:DNA-binding transcriptional regulator YhcF (GntR family)
MRIEVDPKAPSPPSEQIADQVRYAVASGRLKAGDRLPSVRGLAETALVNPNTVAKAYRDLEREGTVETRPGSGVFVAARAGARCEALRDQKIRERVGRAVAEALAAGLTAAEIEHIVARSLRSARVEVTS